MLDKARYLIVEGPISAGKTTLAKRLAERLEASCVLEQPQQNPFIDRFYRDATRWALPTQLAFLLQRCEQLSQLQQYLVNSNCAQRFISDFMLERDPLFAKLNLPTDEYALYQHVYDKLKPTHSLQPDLVIYLQASTKTLIGRIRQHQRKAETLISESYLAQISQRYAHFFYQFDAAPLFIVDTEALNPIDNDEDFELLFERLRAMRGYREFFGYAP